MSTQAQRARAILAEYQQAIEGAAFQLGELSSECNHTADESWQWDDGSAYPEPITEMRAASLALTEARSQLRLLAVSLEYCR